MYREYPATELPLLMSMLFSPPDTGLSQKDKLAISRLSALSGIAAK